MKHLYFFSITLLLVSSLGAMEKESSTEVTAKTHSDNRRLVGTVRVEEETCPGGHSELFLFVGDKVIKKMTLHTSLGENQFPLELIIKGLPQ